MWGCLDKNYETIKNQYARVAWNEADGLAPDKLERECDALLKSLTEEGAPKPIIKARVFAHILDNAQLAAEPTCFLQDHIRHSNILQNQRRIWFDDVMRGELSADKRTADEAFKCGFYRGECDFGHSAPDWERIMRLGLPGILSELSSARDKHARAGTLTPDRITFYTASSVVYEAAIRYALRLAGECERVARLGGGDAGRLMCCADALKAISAGAPRTLHEALQLGYIFHILQEEIEGERLRSFGGIDRLYRPFYEADIASGKFTPEQEKELLKHMMLKFFALTGDQLYGEPMYIGGVYPDGSSAVCDMTYVVIDAFDELNIANPKFHARVAANSPREYVERVLDCIRRGNSSFVFLSDEAAVSMLTKTGASVEEARDYVPIGCYEPCVLGKEVGCTGGAGINLAKALELALNNGVDPVTGKRVGIPSGDAESLSTFDALKRAVKKQIEYGIDMAVNIVNRAEAMYMRINPSPLFSATMESCVINGVDAFAGGAKYNNSSINGVGQGTLADSLVALKKHVYDTGEYTLKQFVDILNSDWAGEEFLRARIKHDIDKWGNDRPLPDELAVEFTRYFSDLVNSRKNARGGRYKAAIISINNNYTYGRKMGATPDGRVKGEAINKNLGASVTMDRHGVTSHMNSVLKIDHTELPNGSVLELMFHPTAVAGAEGLEALAGVVRTYISGGGFALHLNVFDANILKRARAEPDKFRNLQVRVCGWNQYFVNLTEVEQDDFIRQAEAL